MGSWKEIKEGSETSVTAAQKWGSLSCLLLSTTFIVPPWIYLVGDLRTALGPFAYALADFLFGPACAASLIITFVVLGEHIGERAPRRMSLAVLAAALAGTMFVAVAFFRSANRQYLIQHPELEYMLLPAWSTLVAGVIATGWHCMGWALMLMGSAGWVSRHLPRGLSVLYIVTGAVSLFVYLLPDAQGASTILSVAVSIWQAIVLWRAEPVPTPASELTANQTDHA